MPHRRTLGILFTLAALAPGATLLAQDAARTVPVTPPAAREADIATPEAIVAALYEAISGPAGAARDWDRFRSLMLPSGRMMMTFPRRDGTNARGDWTVEEYIRLADPGLVEHGFYEREIGVRQERFGAVAHRWSAYDSRATPDGKPFQRGVNSFQLWHDGHRWWVVSVLWDNERAGLQIPVDLAPAGP